MNLLARRIWAFLLPGLVLALTEPSQASTQLSPIELNQLRYTAQTREAILALAQDGPLTDAEQALKKADYWVVTFVSARCPCSRAHETRMKELARKHAGSRFAFLGVHSNSDEPAAEAKAHFESAKLPFPVLSDPHGQWLHALGALKTPHAYILETRSGRIMYQGGIDDSTDPARASRFYLAEAIEDVSAGREPREARTRALGCQIKRD